MLNAIKNSFRRFRRDEQGTIVVEAMLFFPLLLSALLMSFVFFDAFRNQSINLKANYTIADAISRETDYITNAFVNNTWNLHKFLTNSQHLTKMRISIISYDAVKDEHRIVWSRARGGGQDYNSKPISNIGLNTADIPIMPNNEILIVVQTEVVYEPTFNVGLDVFAFTNVSYTRPRFAPDNICYSHSGSEGGRICPLDS